jgi:hypothetical protein
MGISEAIARVRRSATRSSLIDGALSYLGVRIRSDLGARLNSRAVPAPLRPLASRLATLIASVPPPYDDAAARQLEIVSLDRALVQAAQRHGSARAIRHARARRRVSVHRPAGGWQLGGGSRCGQLAGRIARDDRRSFERCGAAAERTTAERAVAEQAAAERASACAARRGAPADPDCRERRVQRGRDDASAGGRSSRRQANCQEAGSEAHGLTAPSQVGRRKAQRKTCSLRRCNEHFRPLSHPACCEAAERKGANQQP